TLAQRLAARLDSGLLLERPELKNRPVVISAKGKRGREVRLASKPARDQGVCAGMPLAEAEALLEPRNGTRSMWGALCLEESDPAADRVALEQRALWCQRYSPVVGLDDASTPEAILLSLDGCAHLAGGEESLAWQLARDFTQGGHHVRTAVADTIGAAWGLARHMAHSERGPVMVEGESATQWLDRLPIDALRLTDTVLATLRELGVFTVGMLRTLPRSSLPSRLGAGIIRRLDQMWGEIPELITPVIPAAPLLREWSFDEPVSDRAILENVLQLLIEQMVAELELTRTGAQRLDCRLYCLGREPLRLTVGAVRPRSAVKHWHDLLRLQLERTPLPGDVLRMEVEATTTGTLEIGQATLFDDGRNARQTREFETLLDRLSSRLGDDAVLRPSVVAEHQPEWAGRYEPAALPPASTRPPVNPTPAAGARPLAMKPQPVPIVVLSLAPLGAPARFEWTGAEHVVFRSWGPERIEAGWWRGPNSRRDYYRVETTTGQRFWLFRDRESAAWFLQGVFE
ncbi:MAG: hypothetical protein NT069_23525, partial [Planctomycetota bacterium]|nr:hypothetical protein [Planctomycetota bacterium]